MKIMKNVLLQMYISKLAHEWWILSRRWYVRNICVRINEDALYVCFNIITEHLQNKVGVGVCTWRTRPVCDSPRSCHQTLSCGGHCMTYTASSPPDNPCPLLSPSIYMIFLTLFRTKKNVGKIYLLLTKLSWYRNTFISGMLIFLQIPCLS